MTSSFFVKRMNKSKENANDIVHFFIEHKQNANDIVKFCETNE